MRAWLKVFVMGLFLRVPAKVAAPFVVPFLDDEQRVNHPVWGCRDATDLSWWNIGVRNGVHNWLNIDQPNYSWHGNTDDFTMEKYDGLQWRICESFDGEYVSFRMTWGKRRPKRGKREFYIGWTMNEDPEAGLTFFQLRPF